MLLILWRIIPGRCITQLSAAKNTAARQILREAVFLIHIKHFGNIIILRRLGQGQRGVFVLCGTRLLQGIELAERSI